MRNQIYDQLARTTLLPAEQSSVILSGKPPALEEIITSLLIGALDCEAMIGCDPKSTWNERRSGRLCLILAFLMAISMGRSQA
jgi:hypothetical protein